MQFIDMSDYNRNARAYWWVTTPVGALAFGYALVRVLQLSQSGRLGVVALMRPYAAGKSLGAALP